MFQNPLRQFFRNWNKYPKPVDIGTPYGKYAGLVAQSLAASRSCFQEYRLKVSTRAIDVDNADLDALLAAYTDCRQCVATEYPEMEEGVGRAGIIIFNVEEAARRRFRTELSLLYRHKRY